MKTSVKRYIALIEHEPGTLYGVRFPDLPGCTSAGESADEAAENAMEALRMYVEDIIDCNEEVPQPRGFDAILADAAIRKSIEAGAVPTPVPLYLSTNRVQRANISMDSGMLAAIDDAASRYGLTRSAFLTEAAREKIGM